MLTDDQALANIAANVKRLRGDRSQYWLAKQLGITPIQVSRLENGENMPGAGRLARLAEVLGTTTDALLSLDATSRRKKNLSTTA